MAQSLTRSVPLETGRDDVTQIIGPQPEAGWLLQREPESSGRVSRRSPGPSADVVVDRGQRPALDPIQVETAAQVVDFVLTMRAAHPENTRSTGWPCSSSALTWTLRNRATTPVSPGTLRDPGAASMVVRICEMRRRNPTVRRPDGSTGSATRRSTGSPHSMMGSRCAAVEPGSIAPTDRFYLSY